MITNLPSEPTVKMELSALWLFFCLQQCVDMPPDHKAPTKEHEQYFEMLKLKGELTIVLNRMEAKHHAE